jgi:ribosomal protein S18 acetylase RimI-like enzyme
MSRVGSTKTSATWAGADDPTGDTGGCGGDRARRAEGLCQISRSHWQASWADAGRLYARVAEGSVRVLEDARGLAGILVVLPQDGYLLLDNIAVAPERQGEGIGRRLLAVAESDALQRGFDEFRLYTNAAMHENLAMYAKLGWQEYGRAKQAGYQRMFFRKKLGGQG